ncbi:CHAD domain-containing protein [Sphingomonas sp. 66-10]|uniref:CHAD domain-containing protein n=1 Tax=Sphingomonas sp. 66-10 TaxID=1895848 RepID=UPI00257F5BA6|nr:CHAD domain-containing protein [Sphingomonas sp. 66-10]
MREIELELHEGSARIPFDTAREIASRVPVRIAVLSKSERGYRLLGGGMTTPARAEPIQLERNANASEAFAAITHSCLLQFRLNEMLLVKNAEVEAVHQARVALRRLRTAFWLYGPLLAHDSEAPLLEIELRWLTGRLGEVRNLDVLIPHADEQAGLGLREARERAMAALRVDLASSRVRGLMLDLAEWLAVGAWRVRSTVAGDPDDATSFAGNALRKLRKRLKRCGKGLAKLGPRRRHKVRMTAKKLRYASEFFVSLFPAAEAARRYSTFAAALSVLQDSLGELNDLDLEWRVLKSDAGARKRRHQHRRHNRKLLRRAARGYDRLIEAGRFWCVDPLPAA